MNDVAREAARPAPAAGEDRLSALVGAEALDRIAADIEQAAGLPNQAFTTEAFYALEQQRLFPRTWVLAGFGREIPEPGDIAPVEVAGAPILLLRSQDGTARAFHNVCRHRGSRLLAEPCRGRKRITCPYHAWAYDLGGTLVARPYFAGSSPREQALPGSAQDNLVPVRTAEWLDLIFVNLSGNAPALEAHIRPMVELLAPYDLSALRHAGTLAFEVEANWKLACENYIETYHVFAAHPKLARFVPMKHRGAGGFDGPCLYNAYRFPAPEPGRGSGLPYYPGLAEDLHSQGLWFLLFPTLGIEVWPDQFAVFRVIPVGPERTREEIHVYLMGEAATAPRHTAGRQRVLDMWRDLNHEDIGLLENLQAGRHSPSYAGGVFSPHWEAACLHFARLVVAGLE